MREVKYLSPTAIMLYQKDPEAFYLQYCATNRPPKEPQNRAMAIGAAFDAYVKSFLTQNLFGRDKGFDLFKIFEDQVEPHNRDWAWSNGNWAFQQYLESGALADLMFELQGADSEPKFEMTIESRVAHEACMSDVCLLGKPDIHYRLRDGEVRVVHDWKVNGYMSQKTTSPKKGYVQLYDKGERRGFHKEVSLGRVAGLDVNISHPLETVDKSWATQTAIYSWILGAGIGEKFLIGIHQLCCRGGGEFPIIRVAAHRNYVGREFQEKTWAVIVDLWQKVKEGKVVERQEALDNYYSGEDKDDFLEVSR
jgi:hypothetical protein